MKKIIIGLIGLGVLCFALYSVLFRGDTDTGASPEVATVQKNIETIIVGELISDQVPVVAFGQVVTSDSVTVVPETSGLVKRVYKQLGQTARAGETIIELQNATEAQAVAQARAQLQQAEASLVRTNATQPENLSNLEAGVIQAENNVTNQVSQRSITLAGLRTDILSILENTIDPFFTNEESISRQFIPPSKSQRGEEEVELGYDLLNKNIQAYVSFGEEVQIERSKTIILEMTDYLQKLLVLVDTVTISQSTTQEIVDRWRNSLLEAKQRLEQIQATLSTQNTAIANAEESLRVATNNFATTEKSDQSADTAISEGEVAFARARLGAAQVEFDKTFIKAPTFGRISLIETRVGQLVGQSEAVFSLSSSGAKRIDIFLTEREVAQIEVGSLVRIENIYNGTVARIAPTIDQQTGKVKVEIFVAEDVTLVEGTGVGVSITPISIVGEREFSIPIEAVFVRGDQSFVYVRNDENRAAPTPIETEGLFGAHVVVTSGLDAEDEIVLFARAIKDNQQIVFDVDNRANDIAK